MIEISFQVGDMEETNWIPPSFCFQASALALYLLSVSGCVGFICEIDVINNKVKSSPLCACLIKCLSVGALEGGGAWEQPNCMGVCLIGSSEH